MRKLTVELTWDELISLKALASLQVEKIEERGTDSIITDEQLTNLKDAYSSLSKAEWVSK